MAMFRLYNVVLALIEIPGIVKVICGGSIANGSLWYTAAGASVEANSLNAAFLGCLVAVRFAVAIDRRKNFELGIAATLIHAIEIPLFASLYRTNVLPHRAKFATRQLLIQDIVLAFVFINPILFARHYFGQKKKRAF